MFFFRLMKEILTISLFVVFSSKALNSIPNMIINNERKWADLSQSCNFRLIVTRLKLLLQWMYQRTIRSDDNNEQLVYIGTHFPTKWISLISMLSGNWVQWVRNIIGMQISRTVNLFYFGPRIPSSLSFI